MYTKLLPEDTFVNELAKLYKEAEEEVEEDFRKKLPKIFDEIKAKMRANASNCICDTIYKLSGEDVIHTKALCDYLTKNMPAGVTVDYSYSEGIELHWIPIEDDNSIMGFLGHMLDQWKNVRMDKVTSNK